MKLVNFSLLQDVPLKQRNVAALTARVVMEGSLKR